LVDGRWNPSFPLSFCHPVVPSFFSSSDSSLSSPNLHLFLSFSRRAVLFSLLTLYYAGSDTPLTSVFFLVLRLLHTKHSCCLTCAFFFFPRLSISPLSPPISIGLKTLESSAPFRVQTPLPPFFPSASMAPFPPFLRAYSLLRSRAGTLRQKYKFFSLRRKHAPPDASESPLTGHPTSEVPISFFFSRSHPFFFSEITSH